MDSKTIRRANLDVLKKQFGTWAALAQLAGCSPNYLSQIKGGTREVGDELARRLESGAKKPRGWMDVRHDQSTAKPTWTDSPADKIARIYTSLSDARQQALMAAALQALDEDIEERQALRNEPTHGNRPVEEDAAGAPARDKAETDIH